MMINKLIFFTISVFFFCIVKGYSQKKEGNRQISQKKQKFERAILKKGVSAAADGCGWMIEFPKTKKSYKFVEMPGSFKMLDKLDVEVKYVHIEEKYLCGRGRAKIDQIKILEIRAYLGKKKKRHKKRKLKN